MDEIIQFNAWRFSGGSNQQTANDDLSEDEDEITKPWHEFSSMNNKYENSFAVKEHLLEHKPNKVRSNNSLWS